jgi:hypothetical protein
VVGARRLQLLGGGIGLGLGAPGAFEGVVRTSRDRGDLGLVRGGEPRLIRSR